MYPVRHIPAVICLSCVLLVGLPALAANTIPHPIQTTLKAETGATDFHQLDPQLRHRGQSLDVTLQLGPQTYTLLLDQRQVRGPNFRVRVQDDSGALKTVDVPATTLYTGRVEGQPDSRALLRLQDGRLTGTVTLTDHDPVTWEIRPFQAYDATDKSDGHLAYRAVNNPDREPATCGLDTSHLTADEPGLTTPPPAQKDAQLDIQVLELACDTDFDYFTLCGGTVESTVADMEMIIAGVSAIYEWDVRISIQLGELIIRSTEAADPYNTTNPDALLSQFSTIWRDTMDDVDRDLAHFFTGKDLDGTPIGIAWLARGICNTYSGYSLVQSHFDTELARRIAVSAHEIGHNFDNHHCDYVDNWCRIMCPNMAGCSGGYHSFGPWTIEHLNEDIAIVDCFDPGTVTMTQTTLPFFDDFQSSGVPDVTKWTAVDEAKNIYGRLELEAGDTYGVNELGTVRTLPMELTGSATLTFKTRSYGLPAGQPLRIEYFQSSTWEWILLGTVTATGGTSNPLVENTMNIPATAAGSFFSIRLTADGFYGDYNDEWHIDDFGIEASGSTPVLPTLEQSDLIRSVSPNPFNPATTVTFNQPKAGHADILIQDLSGRRVATLGSRHFAEGVHQLVWNGQDSVGRKMASGTYMLVVKTNDQTASAKLVLLK